MTATAPTQRSGTSLHQAGAHFARSLRGPALPARVPAARAVERHLILAYWPGWQSTSDLEAITAHVRDIDPSIATFVLPQTYRNLITRAAAASLPTLVVSPGEIQKFKPARGKIYQGAILPKIEEIQRLEEAGVTVPRTAILTPDLRLESAEWGEFVILKPTDIATSSHGLGVKLTRTKRVRYLAPKDYPRGHPGRLGPMMVQQFVDTGDHISVYRILTFFGEPLYAMVDRGVERRVALDAADDAIERAIVATQATRRHESFFVHDADVLAMARAAHAAIPEVPLKGCDILREKATGKLYVLELNCGGNTWHFSSRQQSKQRLANGHEFELRRVQQFDAMRTAARVLVDRTNAEAE